MGQAGGGEQKGEKELYVFGSLANQLSPLAKTRDLQQHLVPPKTVVVNEECGRGFTVPFQTLYKLSLLLCSQL